VPVDRLCVITVDGVRREWSCSWRVLTQSETSKLGTTVVHGVTQRGTDLFSMCI